MTMRVAVPCRDSGFNDTLGMAFPAGTFVERRVLGLV